MVEMLTCIKDWEVAAARKQSWWRTKNLKQHLKIFTLIDYHLCNGDVIF
jgi:hypothetical protein